MPGVSAPSENVPWRVAALLMADSVRKVICSLPRQSAVSGQRTHLLKSEIKDDRVRLFLSGRDHP